MAQFKYQAKTADGVSVTGTMEAESVFALRALLRTKDMYLVSGQEEAAGKKKTMASKPMSAKNLTIICKQLASMLGAGVTLIRALDILYQQSEDEKIKDVLRDIYEDVQKGSQFSTALRNRGHAFPHLMIAIVESGEASGTLEECIAKLSGQFEGQARIRRKVVGAMVYPIVLLTITIIAVAAMLIFVLPAFVGMFEESGEDLPGITAALINLSNFLVARWYIVIVVVGLFVTILRRFLSTPQGRNVKDRLYLKIPVIKQVITNVAASSFARTMATLVSSGMPLINGLDITINVVNNAVIEDKLRTMRDDIRTGMSLSYGVKKTAAFPPIVHSMIAIGEESGDLDALLSKLSEYLDDEVEASIERLMTMLEPLLIVFMAICIGTVLVAMYLPLFSIYDIIGG